MNVSGTVTMDNAKALYVEGLKSPPNSSLQIDMSQLEKVDSAAVSLMLVWLREAQRNNVSLSFTNVPDNLSSLSKLYGVADLLATSTAA
jgi:phospholipid transport system transporter-binding protein